MIINTFYLLVLSVHRSLKKNIRFSDFCFQNIYITRNSYLIILYPFYMMPFTHQTGMNKIDKLSLGLKMYYK